MRQRSTPAPSPAWQSDMTDAKAARTDTSGRLSMIFLSLPKSAFGAFRQEEGLRQKPESFFVPSVVYFFHQSSTRRLRSALFRTSVSPFSLMQTMFSMRIPKRPGR